MYVPSTYSPAGFDAGVGVGTGGSGVGVGVVAGAGFGGADWEMEMGADVLAGTVFEGALTGAGEAGIAPGDLRLEEPDVVGTGWLLAIGAETESALEVG